MYSIFCCRRWRCSWWDSEKGALLSYAKIQLQLHVCLAVPTFSLMLNQEIWRNQIVYVSIVFIKFRSSKICFSEFIYIVKTVCINSSLKNNDFDALTFRFAVLELSRKRGFFLVSGFLAAAFFTFSFVTLLLALRTLIVENFEETAGSCALDLHEYYSLDIGIEVLADQTRLRFSTSTSQLTTMYFLIACWIESSLSFGWHIDYLNKQSDGRGLWRKFWLLHLSSFLLKFSAYWIRKNCL